MGSRYARRFKLLFTKSQGIKMNIDEYLKMQKQHYEAGAAEWTLKNKNPVENQVLMWMS